MSAEEQIAEAEELESKGNWWFANVNYSAAYDTYLDVADHVVYLPKMEESAKRRNMRRH